MSLLFIVQFLMGLSIIVAASRQTWAFSRDGALPFASFFRPISQRFGYIPLRAIWGCALLAAVLGLLSLIAPAAAQALFSLAVAGNNVAWGVPIFARVWWGQRKFRPGPFHTGERFSAPIAWAAVTFLAFGILLSMFPVGGPGPTRESCLAFSSPASSSSLSLLLVPFFGGLSWRLLFFFSSSMTKLLYLTPLSPGYELHSRHQLRRLVRRSRILLY